MTQKEKEEAVQKNLRRKEAYEKMMQDPKYIKVLEEYDINDKIYGAKSKKYDYNEDHPEVEKSRIDALMFLSKKNQIERDYGVRR